MKKVLTIAGSDSSGGAGIQADLKTFSAHGVFGMSVITAVTAQNTQGVFAVQDIAEDIITKQIDAIYDDIQVDAVKIGMVSRSYIIEKICERLQHYKAQNIVVDPVMVSKSNFRLLNEEAEKTLSKKLIPIATVVTPNLPEAEVITGMTIDNITSMKDAAKVIHQMGAKYVLVKGGHLKDDSIDILYDGKTFKYFEGKRINTKNTHGTGCTLSAAIASNLGKGLSLEESIKKAKIYITGAIQNSLDIGKGVGPTHHFWELYKKAGIE